MRRRKRLVGWFVSVVYGVVAVAAQAAEPRTDAERVLKAGEELYKKGEYSSAAQRFDAALAANSRDPKALLFASLAQMRLNNPQKAADLMGRLQQEAPDAQIAEDAGRMRTILLREAAERAAQQALTQERQLSTQRTDSRTIAVSTFRNSGSGEFAGLGKALAAMLIDNLSALPNVRVLEREQVEALEQEARLTASGLAEKSTAVRAGKLLRAGRVSAGSHADWTKSPTHLGLQALLVDVDAGTTLAESKSEALATEFFKLVPEVATSFSGALGQPPAQLPMAIQQRLEKPHTKSLPAVLAFGKALDAVDRHDMKTAQESCKVAQQHDPNFELAKRKCMFLPLVWLSMEGVIATMEPVAYAMAGSAVSTSLVPAAIGAAVMAGVIGGSYAAFHGGDGGSDGISGPPVVPTSPPGVAAPNLTGVVNRNVAAGDATAIEMQCSDPDGTATTITNPTSAPGGTFTQTSGNPSTARYRQGTNANQAGQTFMVSFVCTDSGNPPASTTRNATIRVVSPEEPEPDPTATQIPPPNPTPTPQVLCAQTGQFCGSPGNDGACCDVGSGAQCIEAFVAEVPTTLCCAPLGKACSTNGECCPQSGSVICDSDFTSTCCVLGGGFCTTDADCCGNSFCFSFTCFAP